MIVIHRGKEYRDKIRKYKIILDNVHIGDIKENESKSFPIAPGAHTLSLKIDWCSSPQVDFHVAEGETIEFDCGNSMDNILAAITFRRNQYLWLSIREHEVI